jgi:hypothetical protein
VKHHEAVLFRLPGEPSRPPPLVHLISMAASPLSGFSPGETLGSGVDRRGDLVSYLSASSSNRFLVKGSAKLAMLRTRAACSLKYGR